MVTKSMDLDQLLSWVRIGTQQQAQEAEKEIGARFKKVSDSRTKIFTQNVTQGVLLRNLQDFMDDLSYDASQSDDPDHWEENWEEWKKEYKRYLFVKQQADRPTVAQEAQRDAENYADAVEFLRHTVTCDNPIHLAEGGDIVCPECKEIV